MTSLRDVLAMGQGTVKKTKPITIVSVVSPWDDLVHLAKLGLTNNRTLGSLEQAVVMLCRGGVNLAPLPAARYRVDDRPVTCITCIARSQDAP